MYLPLTIQYLSNVKGGVREVSASMNRPTLHFNLILLDVNQRLPLHTVGVVSRKGLVDRDRDRIAGAASR
jgi:hypothetical protein